MRAMIIGDGIVERMFVDQGWVSVSDVTQADLVVFTGGEDVSPCLYGEKTHPTSYCNMNRDFQEIAIFRSALERSIPMVGICRGGQFLNVMSGGKLWQDVRGHAIRGTHRAIRQDVDRDRYINVTSTHHQMMRPGNEGIVLLLADWADYVTTVGVEAHIQGVESVYYPNTNCLCFQPHPEYLAGEGCRPLFFEYIQKYLMKRGE